MNAKLFKYIEASPTAYHACAHTAKILTDNGFTELFENEKWALELGRGYFVRRNGSSVIAFKVPRGDFGGFMIAAAHSDSPCLKIKENPELADKHYVRLSVETYGGMIYSTWLDRPLSVAGRVTVKTEKGIEIRLVDTKEPIALIPNVAIHMNRSANSGMNYNAAVDLIPLYDGEKNEDTFTGFIARAAGVLVDDIVTTDLFLYNPQKGYEWGDFISAPRLDDLQCAFSSLEAEQETEAGCPFAPSLITRRLEARPSRARHLPSFTTFFPALQMHLERIIADLLQTALWFLAIMLTHATPIIPSIQTEITQYG